MKWSVHCGDILDLPADVLICSANPFLTMSGGVGGAYLLRYGPTVQQELRSYLLNQGMRSVPRGSVVKTTAGGGPYFGVLHAVGVDALYATSPEIIRATLREALRQSAALRATRVAIAAIGTGYGRMAPADFGRSIVPLIEEEFPPLAEAIVCVLKSEDFADLGQSIPH